MGEYAIRKRDNQRIKIGTCEDMYYLRWDDRAEVFPESGSLNPATEANHLRFRLPFPDEDGQGPGGGEPFRSIVLIDFVPSEGMPSGRIQLHHAPSGVLISIPCHHGFALPEVTPDMTIGWNGKPPHFWQLRSIRCADSLLHPVVGCCACNEQFRATWEDVLPCIKGNDVLRERLEVYSRIRKADTSLPIILPTHQP